MALSTPVHRPSRLKQQNKKHHTLGHRSKGQVNNAAKGRVSVKAFSKRAKTQLGREQRRNQTKQIRSIKRDEAAARKRSLGTANNPPFLVTLVPLSPNINPRKVLSLLSSCDEQSTVTNSPSGITHISCLRFKQRFSFVIPPVNDLFAILDSVKVSDTVLFLWPGDEELEEASNLLLSSILSQGLPTPVHAIVGTEELSSKKKASAKQSVIQDIELRFAGTPKLHTLERDQDALLLLRQIGAQKQRPIFYRDNRPHLMAEKVQFEGTGSSGTLKVHGYVRGTTLSVNSLVHIPGWGDYQMSRIETVTDPHPFEVKSSRKEAEMGDDEPQLLEEADPSLQETLVTTNEPDPMEGEQTWPTEEELAEADAETESRLAKKTKTRRVPKGTSDYQAAWILESEDEDDDDDDEDDDDCEMDDSLIPIDAQSQAESQEEQDGEDESEEEYEDLEISQEAGVDDAYDETIDYAAEMDAYDKMKAARDDAMFPDEIDTPQDAPARVRFQKYRGLQSFRTSLWDPKENLPLDYSRIFQFESFNRTRKRVLDDAEREGALAGWYVIVHISDVPRHLYDSHVSSGSPLVVFGMLPHEQKMSVLHMVIKSHPLGHIRPIKSKDRLVFHVGYRRFANAPIFSEHTNGNKHKFVRFFQPGSTVVATMFAPITFPPASVMVFRERPDRAQELVGTGSLLSANPNRIMLKKNVLSGHPMQINKKTATARYMFLNREDILWFKPLELRTKWGRKGHIKEPVGTHGHMKCYFDGQLKSQDTIHLNLYKRMFPKWTFDPHVARPPPLYVFKSSNDMESGSSEDEEEEELSPSKRAKKVSFLSAR